MEKNGQRLWTCNGCMQIINKPVKRNSISLVGKDESHKNEIFFTPEIGVIFKFFNLKKFNELTSRKWKRERKQEYLHVVGEWIAIILWKLLWQFSIKPQIHIPVGLEPNFNDLSYRYQTAVFRFELINGFISKKKKTCPLALANYNIEYCISPQLIEKRPWTCVTLGRSEQTYWETFPD